MSDDVDVVRCLAVRYNDLAAAEVVRVALAGVVEKLPPGPSLEPGTGGEILDVPGNLQEKSRLPAERSGHPSFSYTI